MVNASPELQAQVNKEVGLERVIASYEYDCLKAAEQAKADASKPRIVKMAIAVKKWWDTIPDHPIPGRRGG